MRVPVPGWTITHVPLVPRELRLLPFRGSVAIAAGLLTPAQLRGSAWRRLFTDVYIAADVELDHRLMCAAALLAVGSGSRGVAVSGLSAAFVLGVDLLPRHGGAPVQLTAPQGRRIRIPGVEVVRSTLLPGDLMPFGRFLVTSPERTAFDLARSLPRLEAIVAVDTLLRRRLTTIESVRTLALAHPYLRGRPSVFEVLKHADQRSESPMESILRVTIVDGGLPRPECQVNVVGADGRFIGRLDMAYRRARVGIEYEGDQHRERAAFRHDLARINAMQAAGWIIVRVTANDIRNPGKMLAQIRSALARRAS